MCSSMKTATQVPRLGCKFAEVVPRQYHVHLVKKSLESRTKLRAEAAPHGEELLM